MADRRQHPAASTMAPSASRGDRRRPMAGCSCRMSWEVLSASPSPRSPYEPLPDRAPAQRRRRSGRAHHRELVVRVLRRGRGTSSARRHGPQGIWGAATAGLHPAPARHHLPALHDDHVHAASGRRRGIDGWDWMWIMASAWIARPLEVDQVSANRQKWSGQCAISTRLRTRPAPTADHRHARHMSSCASDAATCGASTASHRRAAAAAATPAAVGQPSGLGRRLSATASERLVHEDARVDPTATTAQMPAA